MTTSARMDIRNLTALAAAAALAIFLGYLKLYRMPQGGSITLEAVPILFVALWRGPRTGILAGLFTGVLKLMLDPFIVHPVQVLLDYPLPFFCLGLVAYLPRFPRLGILLASTARWASHV
ncbi:MAG: energy-coupled thiamine transporter ThiT, partial [bacterium]|nr:energy-coupled thiamine transporter ThiT [bacterium]